MEVGVTDTEMCRDVQLTDEKSKNNFHWVVSKRAINWG